MESLPGANIGAKPEDLLVTASDPVERRRLQAEALKEHRDRIAALVRALVLCPSDWADAEQVGALAFLQAFSRNKQPEKASIWTWAYRRVRGAIIDWSVQNRTWFKRNGRRDHGKSSMAIEVSNDDAIDEAEDYRASPEELLATAEIQEIVEDFQDSLTPEDAALLTTTDQRRLKKIESAERHTELVAQISALIRYGEDR